MPSSSGAWSTSTADGIEIKPLYTAADAPASPGLPGACASGSIARGWDIRQSVTIDDPALANAEITDALENGATSIQLRFQTSSDWSVLDRALAGVLMDLAPIGLDAKADCLPAATALLQLAERRGVDAAALRADLNADPLGAMAGGGALDPTAALAGMVGLAQQVAAAWPGTVALLADGRPYHGGGASEAQELAFAVATGIAYLRALVDAGMPADSAAGQIGFALATDADFFLSLAKFRALRRLWGQVLEVAGAEAAIEAVRVHAETAERMFTRIDPHVNILRGTVAAFAAAAGGARSITVLPFDHALGGSAPAARRLARNTQLVLLEEAQLGRVVDPAAGSWYVERLTEDLATKAWSLVQEVERRGGMLQALLQGWPQSQVAASRQRLEAAVAKRTATIVGVSEFAEPGAAPSTRSVTDAVGGGGPIEAVPPFRLAEGFERLRARAETVAASMGAPLRIFLCTLGRQDEFAARATFAGNLFEAGGIAAVAGDPLSSLEDLGSAFRTSGARQVAICSSDANYATHAAAAARAVKQAGAARVYLMGRPDEAQRAAWQAAGVDEFVHAGADVLATLDRALAVEAKGAA